MSSPPAKKVKREVLTGAPKVLPPNSKVKQVIEQDGVLILETVEADPNDPDLLPAGSTIIASGNYYYTRSFGLFLKTVTCRQRQQHGFGGCNERIKQRESE